MVYRVSGFSPENSYTPAKALGTFSGAIPGGSSASGRTLATARSVSGTTGTPLRSQLRAGAAVAAKTPSHTRRQSCGAARGYKTRSICSFTLPCLGWTRCKGYHKSQEPTTEWKTPRRREPEPDVVLLPLDWLSVDRKCTALFVSP